MRSGRLPRRALSSLFVGPAFRGGSPVDRSLWSAAACRRFSPYLAVAQLAAPYLSRASRNSTCSDRSFAVSPRGLLGETAYFLYAVPALHRQHRSWQNHDGCASDFLST